MTMIRAVHTNMWMSFYHEPSTRNVPQYKSGIFSQCKGGCQAARTEQLSQHDETPSRLQKDQYAAFSHFKLLESQNKAI